VFLELGQNIGEFGFKSTYSATTNGIFSAETLNGGWPSPPRLANFRGRPAPSSAWAGIFYPMTVLSS